MTATATGIADAAQITVAGANMHPNAQGEVTLQSLWSRCGRHFVGIRRHNALS